MPLDKGNLEEGLAGFFEAMRGEKKINDQAAAEKMAAVIDAYVIELLKSLIGEAAPVPNDGGAAIKLYMLTQLNGQVPEKPATKDGGAAKPSGQ